MMTTILLLLLVEDEPLIAEMMQTTLEEGGYKVILAERGSEALAAFEANRDELAALITDIRLGSGPNGWEVARHARHMKPDLPVVYMTGDSAVSWAAEGVPKSLLLQKPFATAQLVTAVSTLLNEASSNSVIGGS